MPSLRLTVETVSPLLMYGADQNEPELRGASLRGILRYWLRAVLGSQFTRSSELYKAESNILGSTDEGSKVNVRVQKSRDMQPASNQWVLPERTSRDWTPRYDAFPEASEFRITLSTHPLDASDVLAEDGDLVKAVFLMIHLGGLGKRSRRGSGNLRVKNVRGYDGDPALDYLANDRDDLKTYLSNICDHINRNNTVGNRPNFSTFAPDTCVVLLGKQAYGSIDEVFANNGDLWRVSGPYHHSGGIFGDVRPRRSSAIHMRVALCREGYVPLQTIFYSGNGRWDDMKRYISDCHNSGFDQIYGDESGWR